MRNDEMVAHRPFSEAMAPRPKFTVLTVIYWLRHHHDTRSANRLGGALTVTKVIRLV